MEKLGDVSHHTRVLWLTVYHAFGRLAPIFYGGLCGIQGPLIVSRNLP
jgi:hypothetical protein